MSSRERIASAQVSSDLSEGQDGELADVDLVRACGLVSATMPLGVALWRLKHSDDIRELRHALEGLERLAQAGRREISRERIVSVLRHWIDDACGPCDGRGYMVIAGAPALSDRPCEACGGRGRVALPVEGPEEMWLAEQIDQIEGVTAAAIMRRLRG